jgi:hypothetical protein
VVRATHEALRSMSSADDIGARRGKKLRTMISGQPGAAARAEVPANAG